MASVPTAQPFRILDLPAEIRMLIYEHALRHHKNDGFISPISPKKAIATCPDNTLIDTIVHGEACSIQCQEDIAHRISFPPLPRADDGDGFDAKAHIASGGSVTDICGYMLQDDGTQKPFIAHVCTAACLLQPLLTAVNRQIREETLPVFYGINHFVLDWSTLRQFSNACDPSAVKKWWRAIEDTNLRLIKHFCVNSPDVRVYKRETVSKFSFSVHKGASYVDIQTTSRASSSQDSGGIPVRAGPGYSEALRQIGRDGLFVRGIERVLFVGGVLGGDVVAW